MESTLLDSIRRLADKFGMTNTESLQGAWILKQVQDDGSPNECNYSVTS
jgi:hypothetical protein